MATKKKPAAAATDPVRVIAKSPLYEGDAFRATGEEFQVSAARAVELAALVTAISES